MDLYAELRRIVEALDRAAIGYALVGGLAVSIYTTPRATEDVDLAIGSDDVERAVEALGRLGFRRAARPMRVAAGHLQIQRLIKIEGSDVLPLDLLVAREASVGALLNDRASVEWEGLRMTVVSIESLRALKRLRGSAQDRADLEALGPDQA